MAIDAISDTRASAAYRREAARMTAHQYSLFRAEARRDTRVAEAKTMDAARATPAERGAERPPRAPAKIIDLLA